MPSRIVSVTAAAAARLVNGSAMYLKYSGISPPPGKGVARLAGMWVCSVTHIDSRPRASTSFARTSGMIMPSTLWLTIPSFIPPPPQPFELRGRRFAPRARARPIPRIARANERPRLAPPGSGAGITDWIPPSTC